MATSYPGGIDAFTNPTATDSLASATVPHATQHANANDAIEAIETELGTNPKGASASVKARLDTLDTTVSGKAPSASPTFTGTVTTPLTTAGYVKTSAGGVLSSAAAIAQADVTNLTTDLAAKAPTASPTFTGVVAVPDGTVSAPSIANDGDANTGLYFPADNSIALATDGVARLSIDSAGLITGTGTSLGAYVSYTPTLAGTGWALGNGTVTGKYSRIGRWVSFWAAFVAGSTSTFGSGNPRLSLPVTPISDAVEGRWNVAFFDSSASLRYFSRGILSSSDVIAVTSGTNGVQTTTNSTTPFAWATSDTIIISGIYEASA